jgi:hypothetical protein
VEQADRVVDKRTTMMKRERSFCGFENISSLQQWMAQ